MEKPAKRDVPRDLEGVHLIVVEDDAILLMDLEAILRCAGAKALRLCRTVEEGLTAAEMEGISAALLDVRVGRHPVAPVARRLFQRGIPFVFYTGQPSDDPAIIEWPDSKFVTKPARPQAIVSAILDVLRELKAGDNSHMRATSVIRLRAIEPTALIARTLQSGGRATYEATIAVDPMNDLPAITSLKTLYEAEASCTRCALFRNATQAVPGEGPIGARMMMVGEQPGDQEDLAGRPFVGPAGRVLDRAITEAGIDRKTVFVTNAVKHFKFEPRGKRRLHQKPNAYEIERCRWWNELEREIVKAGPRRGLRRDGGAQPVGTNGHHIEGPRQGLDIERHAAPHHRPPLLSLAHRRRGQEAAGI